MHRFLLATFKKASEEFAEGKIAENQRNPGAWIRSYKNGSKLFMPAPDFKGDSKNQASRDFNTVVIDDYLRAEDQGDGIDKQLVDRARAPSLNSTSPNNSALLHAATHWFLTKIRSHFIAQIHGKFEIFYGFLRNASLRNYRFSQKYPSISALK